MEHKMKMKLADIGVVGLAVMGENLILNIAAKGFTVITSYSIHYTKLYDLALPGHQQTPQYCDSL